ncbi:MAG: ferritin-like domain-containing protein [Nevskia sp.]
MPLNASARAEVFGSDDPRTAIHAALTTRDPAAKCAAVAAIRIGEGWQPLDTAEMPAADPRIPGRPGRPALVRPRDVPYRGIGSVAGRAALIHAVAHIEFNAINLALDAAWRFRGLPADYYRDWLLVAKDEARHFALLRTRLRQLGFDYGDLAAHNGLWEAAEKTAHDVLDRMCCVPRVLEARGLDVTPGIILRLREVRDLETVAILETILAEEIGHVEIGTRWFRWLCAQRGIDPFATSQRLLAEQGLSIRPPINEAARLAAGFTAEELRLLVAAAS